MAVRSEAAAEGAAGASVARMISSWSTSERLSHEGISTMKAKRSASAGSSGSEPMYPPSLSSVSGGFMAAQR